MVPTGMLGDRVRNARVCLTSNHRDEADRREEGEKLRREKLRKHVVATPLCHPSRGQEVPIGVQESYVVCCAIV